MAEQVAIKSGEAYKLPRFLLLFFISQIPHMPAITQKIAGMLVPKLFMLIAPAPISAAAAIKFITMQKIKEMVDVNTIIGDPITSPDGTIIIPVSKVSFGFVAGGSDLPTKAPKEVFAGGSGAGITINPQAFIVVQRDGEVKMLELGANSGGSLEGIISGVPDLISKVKAIFAKDNEEEAEKESKED